MLLIPLVDILFDILQHTQTSLGSGRNDIPTRFRDCSTSDDAIDGQALRLAGAIALCLHRRGASALFSYIG
jgi:hypothetical protein